jgi:hypothetical protein
LLNIFYTAQTVFILPKEKELLWYLPSKRTYFSFENKTEVCPYQDKVSKFLLFANYPHCGDLAWYIRQAKDFDEKDSLLKLLDASYELERLIRIFSNIDAIDAIKGYIPRINSQAVLIIQQVYTHTLKYINFKEYQSVIGKNFKKAILSHCGVMIRNIVLLFLQTDLMLESWLLNQLSSVMIMYEIVDIASSMLIAAYITPANSHEIRISLFWIIFLVLVYNYNKLQDIRFYVKKYSICRTVNTSFFLSMLYYKYSKLKKVMNEYKT